MPRRPVPGRSDSGAADPVPDPTNPAHPSGPRTRDQHKTEISTFAVHKCHPTIPTPRSLPFRSSTDPPRGRGCSPPRRKRQFRAFPAWKCRRGAVRPAPVHEFSGQYPVVHMRSGGSSTTVHMPSTGPVENHPCRRFSGRLPLGLARHNHTPHAHAATRSFPPSSTPPAGVRTGQRHGPTTRAPRPGNTALTGHRTTPGHPIGQCAARNCGWRRAQCLPGSHHRPCRTIGTTRHVPDEPFGPTVRRGSE